MAKLKRNPRLGTLEDLHWLLYRYTNQEYLPWVEVARVGIGSGDRHFVDTTHGIRFYCAGNYMLKATHPVLHINRPLLSMGGHVGTGILKGPLKQLDVKDTPMMRSALYINVCAYLLGYRESNPKQPGYPRLFIHHLGKDNGHTTKLTSFVPHIAEALLKHVLSHPDFGADKPKWHEPEMRLERPSAQQLFADVVQQAAAEIEWDF